MRVTRMVVLAVVLAICLTGCGTPGGKDTLPEEELKVKVLDYLEERYGTYFQVVRIKRDSLFGGPAKGVSVIALDYPDCDEFTVYWTREWWQDTFSDMFLYCPMEEHYQAMAERTATTYFQVSATEIDFPILGRLLEYPESFNSDTTFEEFYQWGRAVIDTQVVVAVPTTSVDDFDQDSAALESDLRKLFPTGSLILRVFTAENYQIWVNFPNRAPHDNNDEYQYRRNIPSEEFLFHEWGQ